MSTVVVVKKNGRACIGADTLTKFGSTKESRRYIENHSKITRYGSTLVAAVGHGSVQLILNSYLSKQNKRLAFGNVEEIFETVREMHGVLKKKYYLNPAEGDDDEFESSRFDALLANPNGIFGIYSLRSVQEYVKFYSLGSGSQLALGAMHAVYESNSGAEVVARTGLEAAAEFDDATDLPVELHTIKLKCT